MAPNTRKAAAVMAGLALLACTQGSEQSGDELLSGVGIASVESCGSGANLVVGHSEDPMPSLLPLDTVFTRTFVVYNMGTEYCESSIAAVGQGVIDAYGSPSISPSSVSLDGYGDHVLVTGTYHASAVGTGAPGVSVTVGGAYLYLPTLDVVGCQVGDLVAFNPFPGTGYISTNTTFYKQWGVVNTGIAECTRAVSATGQSPVGVPNAPGIWSPSSTLTIAAGDTALVVAEYRSGSAGNGWIGLAPYGGVEDSAAVVVCASPGPCP